MQVVKSLLCFVYGFVVLNVSVCTGRSWVTTDELENHISPEDLNEFLKWRFLNENDDTTTASFPDLDYGSLEDNITGLPVPDIVDCFGLGSFTQQLFNMQPDSADKDNITGLPVPDIVDCFGLGSFTQQLFNMQPDSADKDNITGLPVPDIVDCFGLGSFTQQLFNMQPDSADKVNTHFYFSSRQYPERVQVFPGDQFGLEWVDFRPDRQTVMIVHGFMSHSNASWVTDMTRAFLEWGDVNVIAVDWSKGGNTWKYWRAVANTRRVGSDVTGFLRQLIAVTGAKVKDFHFIGHSLGAHISSYVSYHLGGVSRITGLDPAQPCFRTDSLAERLDATDADFVDVIHTNGRLLKRIGFGFPEPTGHADFYPNGGMKQPGCYNTSNSIWARIVSIPVARLQQAICSHGRSYLLFTESLINNNCSFRGHRWNLTYEGVNASLEAACDRIASCSEMGIRAVGGNGLARAIGAYFVLTTDKEPYCPTEWERRHPLPELLHDLRKGFRLDRSIKPAANVTEGYANPDRTNQVTTTTETSWFRKWFG